MLKRLSALCLFLWMLMGLPSAWATDGNPKQSDNYPAYPVINYGTGAQANQLKQGEYLVKLGDCIACHTGHHAPAFSGGLAFVSPFGTLYSSNITPDQETGIGAWTQDQFNRAMREGITAKGHYLYPVFPYLYFNTLTDADLQDIRLYLNAIPAIKHKNQEDDLIWPLSWRFSQIGWQLLFFRFQKPGIFQPDPHQTPEWNRGKYIVEGLGHCAMCHSPAHYLISPQLTLGAPVSKYHLAGAWVEGFYAPNINSRHLKTVTVQQLSDVFLKDHLIEGGVIRGPMKEVNHDSLQYLTPDDIAAIATYLKSVHSKVPPHCADCRSVSASGMRTTHDDTKVNHRIFGGYMAILWICVGVGVVVFGILIISLIKRRQSRNSSVADFHVSLIVEIMWAIIPFILLILMLIPAIKVVMNLNASANQSLDPRIKITDYPWKWPYECLDQPMHFCDLFLTPQAQTHEYLIQLAISKTSSMTTTPAAQPMTKRALMALGQKTYTAYCSGCHQPDGKGMGAFPALAGARVPTGPVAAHIDIVLKGKPGTAMQPFASELTDEQIAAVITYQRNIWGNDNPDKYGKQAGGLVQPADIAKQRPPAVNH